MDTHRYVLTLSLRRNSATWGFFCPSSGDLKMKEETTARLVGGWDGFGVAISDNGTMIDV